MASRMNPGLASGHVVRTQNLTSEERAEGLDDGMHLVVLELAPYTVYRPNDTERALVLSPTTGRTLWLWPDQVTPVLPGRTPDAEVWNVLRRAQDLTPAV